LASETTAAAVGQVGIVRRDPMAIEALMRYNYGDYWNKQWLSFEKTLQEISKMYHVNWFARQDNTYVARLSDNRRY